MKFAPLIFFLSFSLAVCAQTEKPDELMLSTTAPKDTWYYQGKKAALKEATMQLEYALTRPDSLSYLFVVDGQYLSLQKFKDYKTSILQQLRSLHFVKSIDSLMGYPSPGNRTLVLITTED